MKKILVIIALGLMFSGSANAASLYGTGNIEIEKYIYDYIYKYLGKDIRNKKKGAFQGGNPTFLAISLTGKDAGVTYCPYGKKCKENPIIAKQLCEKYAKKNNRASKCKLVFYKSTLKWGGIKNKLTQKNDVKA